MRSRREFLATLGRGAGALALAWACLPAAAQQGRRRIGFLGPLHSASNANRLGALRAGLLGMGFAEGQNFSIEFRGQDRGIETLDDLAKALVRSGVDIIVANAAAETAAAKQATASIPIVMAAANDAVAMRLVADPQRPGGNVTGATYSSTQVMQRRLERLKEAYARARRVALLYDPTHPVADRIVEALKTTAKTLGLELLPTELRAREEIGAAFGSMVREKANAFVMTDDAVMARNAANFAELSISTRLPGIGQIEYAEAGGLMSYEVNRIAAWTRAANYVGRIMRGARPAEMPLEAATRFEMVLNRKGARSLGIAFPQAFAGRADRVIETSAEARCAKC
jgi:putative ABC transport system substrate-binding protein